MNSTTPKAGGINYASTLFRIMTRVEETEIEGHHTLSEIRDFDAALGPWDSEASVDFSAQHPVSANEPDLTV